MVMLVLLAGAIPVAGAPGSAGAALPAGFQETHRLQRPDQPDRGALRKRRPRVRGRAERAHQGVRRPAGPDARRCSPTSAAACSTSGTAGCSGMALDPQFPTRPYVYVSYTHDAAIGGTAPRWGDTCPTPPGATGDGCVVSGRLSKLTASGKRDDGPGAGAGRGLVPAVPEPQHRRPCLRPRRRALHERRRRGQLQLRRLRPGREPAQPLRRPPGGRGRHADDPHRGGRRPAQPGPAYGRRPGEPRRQRDPREPGYGRRAARQPAGGQRRR